MSEQNNKSLYEEQKVAKPKVDEIMNASLKNDNKKNALEFVHFIKSLKMKPQWASANSWAVNYKNKRVCYIKVSKDTTEDGFWSIRPSVEYDDDLYAFCQKENLINIMLQSVHYCGACGKCAPGKRVIFFGKELDNVCCAPIDFEFHNPDIEVMDCAKKLVIYIRNVISDKQG